MRPVESIAVEISILMAILTFLNLPTSNVSLYMNGQGHNASILNGRAYSLDSLRLSSNDFKGMCRTAGDYWPMIYRAVEDLGVMRAQSAHSLEEISRKNVHHVQQDLQRCCGTAGTLFVPGASVSSCPTIDFKKLWEQMHMSIPKSYRARSLTLRRRLLASIP